MYRVVTLWQVPNKTDWAQHKSRDTNWQVSITIPSAIFFSIFNLDKGYCKMAALAHNASFDGRVEDYLDDKFQSTTDLESLDEGRADAEIPRPLAERRGAANGGTLASARQTQSRSGALRPTERDSHEAQAAAGRRVSASS